MDSKYYVPEIEDIRIGYKCEWLQDPTKDFWIPLDITADMYKFVVQNGQGGIDFGIRTPYLIKEQIEAEGWEWKGKDGDDFEYFFTKDEWDILWIPTTKFIAIDKENEPSVFWGKCPSVNEFRFITKLLGINAA